MKERDFKNIFFYFNLLYCYNIVHADEKPVV